MRVFISHVSGSPALLNVLIKKYSNYQKLTIPAVLLAAVTLIAVFSISRFVILRSWRTVSLTVDC
jgi:hypothetical protein